MLTNLPAASSKLALFLALSLPVPATGQQPAEAAARPQAPDQGAEGLPTFLLPVPGGETWVGLSSEDLLRACAESANPRNPKNAADHIMKRLLTNTASELGRSKVPVPTFLLGKWPVKNREFRVFVEKMKALGTPVKPPFHWWREGCEEDYNNRLEEINKLFRAEGKMGPLYYWEQRGTELPFALKDKDGNDISEHPVAYVSYRDAVKFAGWLGMRLPNEAEWTRAVRGDGEHIWPWAWRPEFEDHYIEDIKDQLGLANARDIRRKDCGTVKFATGPFGHFDMTGQVWEYTAGLGYRPIGGQNAFEDEWKRLQKDKIGGLAEKPLWKDDRVIVKGGSYLSYEDPIQLHIDSRVGLPTIEVLDGVGFRLAKSLQPGYDMLYSLVKSDYNRDLLLYPDLDVDLTKVTGLERYALDSDGFPEEYHAVAFAPLNMLTDDKRDKGKKLDERSWLAPLPIGTLSLTEPALKPKLTGGIYTVAWRRAGMPRELDDAIKRGNRDIKAAIKRNKDKGLEEVLKEIEGDWKSTLMRFGLKPADVAVDIPKFVRLGKLEVSTERDMLLFFDNNGEWAAATPGSRLTTAKELGPTDVVFDSAQYEGAEHARVTFQANMPLLKDGRQGAEYKIELILEQGPPSANAGWRLPPSLEK